MSAVSVQDSQAYGNMYMTRERISLIFELSAIFLSFQITLSFASAAVVWAILARISGLDPSSAMIAPRYLNLLTQSSFSPLTLNNMLVRPKLEYASPIWNPHITTQIKHLEKV